MELTISRAEVGELLDTIDEYKISEERTITLTYRDGDDRWIITNGCTNICWTAPDYDPNKWGQLYVSSLELPEFVRRAEHWGYTVRLQSN